MEALQLVADQSPHVIVLEPSEILNDSVSTIRSLRRAHPRSALLVIPPYRAGDRTALLEAGAHVVLARDAGAGALLAAARYLATPAKSDAARESPIALSPRELQVVRCAAAAMTNQQIASRLGITLGTVKRHLHSAFRKLGAVSRLDAVRKALTAGLLSAPVPAPAPVALKHGARAEGTPPGHRDTASAA
ncbi:LuxR C-terminal-related transcriptional regulator [Streptomyces sp. QL37]|uniref:helix-turn-helix transcriptional regulator n=1 Tax=Streptomyces sp. QL37 TaxID=2093747 RepID=UPI001C9E39FD|nr:LuxR C-terminal-related transcriptional regulator [Streptomyces sp. QL37]